MGTTKTKWFKTKFPGVRYREHPTRKHGVNHDRYFVVRYQFQCPVSGEKTRIEEPVGWASGGETAESANEALAMLRKAARTGEGPRSLRQRREIEKAKELEKARQAEKNRPFGEIADLFLADCERRLREKTIDGYRSCLKKARTFKPGRSLPPLKDWPIRDIERRHLAALVNKVAEVSPAKAILIRSTLSALFTFAIHAQEEYVDQNPVRNVKRPNTPSPRERYLKDPEIKALLPALDKATGDEPLKRMIRFALFTGCRLSEAREMHMREVNGLWWTIPAERFKGKREHTVFLTATALRLLDGAGEIPFANPLIHIDPDTGGEEVLKPYEPSSIARYLKRMDYFGLGRFGVHDFRRTLATGLAEEGFSLEIIGAVLGHKLPGVTGAHYQKYQYNPEKQKAAEAWERHILGLFIDKKKAPVIPLSFGSKKTI